MKPHLFPFTQITLILIGRFNTTAERKKTSSKFNGTFTCKLRGKGQCDRCTFMVYRQEVVVNHCSCNSRIIINVKNKGQKKNRSS